MEKFTDNRLTKKEKREIRRQEKIGEAEKDRQKKAARKALGWVVVLSLIAVAAFAVISREGSVNEPVDLGELRQDDWVWGTTDAENLLIVYSDFECPACSAYAEIMEVVLEEIPDDILYVYRYFPLKGIHPKAEFAARAAEAAGRQNKFWEMHDLIFADQAWTKGDDFKSIFVNMAKQLGLSLEDFERDYESKEVAEKVDGQYNEAKKAGFNSTPTFILNGEKIGSLNVPKSSEDFIKLINGSE